jgi:hypothetical protein
MKTNQRERCIMAKENHSLKIETGWFKATATGWGLVVLLAIVAMLTLAHISGWG